MKRQASSSSLKYRIIACPVYCEITVIKKLHSSKIENLIIQPFLATGYQDLVFSAICENFFDGACFDEFFCIFGDL
jgi:hypothetical protein